MHVYISEGDKFTQFDDEKYLQWKLENIEYGNWNAGDNFDGTFIYNTKFELTPVNYFYYLS